MILCLLLVLLVVVPVVCTAVDTHRDRGVHTADCAVVPGCRVCPDGTPSLSLRNRCETAAKAYLDGRVRAVIVCGGRGKDEPVAEAEAMRLLLTRAGVPDDVIFTEDRSVSTRENLVNARGIMVSQGFGTALIVTSDYHIGRSLRLARDLGVTAFGCAAPGPATRAGRLKALLRETVSRMKYRLERRRYRV